jgi:hypothetical protein
VLTVHFLVLENALKKPGSWHLMCIKAHVARTYHLCVKREFQADDSADFESMLAVSVHPKPYLSFVTFLEATWLSLRRGLPREQQVATAFRSRSCETVVALALALFVLLPLALVVVLALALFVLVKRRRSVP